ncbi:mitochondrial import receptor subunit Tom70p [Monosporozyma unispora]|nr:TOM (translocase of outer membrane) complex component [Kazachstania unispora]
MAESSNSNPGFWYRHRTAIVTTVVSVSTAVSAYYVYKQLKQVESEAKSKSKAESTEKQDNAPVSKSKKKRDKQKQKKKQQEVDDVSKITYPILPSGEPDIEAIKLLSNDEIDKITLELKDSGNTQFKLKNFDNAIKFYNFALEIKEDPVFYSNISACYVSTNQYDKVIEYCNKALELKPDYSKVLLRRATAFEQKGNYQDAMFDLSVLSLNNDFNGASIEPILERNLNLQAMRTLNEMQGNSNDELNHLLPSDTSLASFFNMLTPPELEFDNFNENIDADIILHNALNALYKFTHDGFEIASKDFLKAIIAYKDLLKNCNEQDEKKVLETKLSIALEYNGILSFMKADIITAQDNLNESIKLHPRVKANVFLAMILADKWATSMMQAGTTQSNDEQIDNEKLRQQYLSKFDDAIALDPTNPIIYYHRGQISFIAQEYSSSRADFTKSIELNPNNCFPYIQLACLAYRENNFTDCEKQFTEARKRFPLQPEIPTFYAELLTDKNDLNQALKEYDIAIKLEKAISEKENGKIHVGVAPLIGKAAIIAKQQPVTPENFQLATDLFQTAVDEDPRNEQALVALAQLKLQQEEVDTSIELFEKAAHLCRTNEERLQAITFAEAAKIQKRIRADPIISQRVEEALAQYRAQGLI